MSTFINDTGNVSVGSQSQGRVRIYTKISTGESTSYTFTSEAGSASDEAKVTIINIPGGVGFNLVTADDNNGNGTETVSPICTTTTNNEEVFRVVWNHRNQGILTFPAGWDVMFDGTVNPSGNPTAGHTEPDGLVPSVHIAYQTEATPTTNGPITIGYTKGWVSMQNIVFSIQK